MQLRTRIALTFLLLLGAVIGAALFAVSAANRTNAEREIGRQLEVGGHVFERALESNRRQLAQAAQVLASDFGFREAVASGDRETVSSALENHSGRIGASLAVLLSLDGRVLATTSATTTIGQRFATTTRNADGSDAGATIAVEDGHVYQLVRVPVRSPLPTAWVVMGFVLDETALRELAAVTGLDVTLAVRNTAGWTSAASTLPAPTLRGALASLTSHAGSADFDLVTSTLALSDRGDTPVTAVLSRSLAEARKPFDRLSQWLVLIACLSLTLTAVAAFWLARNITRPLQALAAVVEGIRAGRYDSEVAVGRRDEIGTLAEGLQLMRCAVESRDRDIRALAFTDRLTGLMNRTAFTEALSADLANREHRVVVALINIRRFRRINECLGFAIGDAVLQQLAERLRDPPHLSTHIARVAGDYFAAYTPIGHQSSPEQWGTSLLNRLAAPVRVSEQAIDIHTEIGLAVTVAESVSADDLLRCADLALEQARREAVDLRVYDASLKVSSVEQLSLLGELQRAIDQGELLLAFQPKIDLGSGTTAGVEALIRWRHPTRGMLPPAAFIPFAEQTGFIRKLTRWALREAATTAAAWAIAGKPLPISVNISAEDLTDNRFDNYVGSILRDTGLPAQLLMLELTESGFIGDPEQALLRVECLKTLGLGLSIDDFGTGYSSLSYLARMPVDELKIDRSFVIAMATSEEVTAVVRAALEMARGLGLKVVAEGIEDAATGERLAALGCQFGQGYFYGKPMLRTDFEAWRDARPIDAAIDNTTRNQANAPKKTASA